MLATIGASVLLIIGLVLFAVIVDPFGGRAKDQFSLAINTPFVGQGVEVGTAVVLHGVEVGHVTNVSNTAGGGVRLVTDLQSRPLQGLTDSMTIDFRPINYFGVPGINVVPNSGGQLLRDGSQITVTPKGNFTLSELLSQLGGVSESALTPQLVQVIDRVTRYTDGLNPLLETAITVVKAADAVQTIPTKQLLYNTTSVVGALPPFAQAVINAGTRVIDFNYYPGKGPPTDSATSGPSPTFPYMENVTAPNWSDESEEYFQTAYLGFMQTASGGLFAAVGKLLFSHTDDLFPLIAGLKAITDTGPVLLRPQDIAQKLGELRARFEKLYAGNGDQRAVNVHILLDSMPGVAAPLGIVPGGPQ